LNSVDKEPCFARRLGAFDATMKDPAFLAEAAKLQLDVSPMTGEEVQTLVGELARTPKEIVDRVKTALDAPAAK